jgi:hypothetical protein
LDVPEARLLSLPVGLFFALEDLPVEEDLESFFIKAPGYG